MATNNSPNDNTRLTGILERLAIGTLFALMTWQYNAQQKLEDRIYNMQGEMFTEEKARVLEARITNNVEAIRKDVNARLDILISLQRNK